MEKRADWIKEIYVDQADNSNKLKAQTDVTDSKVLDGISQIQYEIPGFVDFHLHAGWTDFDHDDQEKRSNLDVEGRIKRCLNELAAMGFRIVRDAGGLECIKADAWKQSTKENALSVVECSGMVNGENAKDSAFQNCIKKRNSLWVKIFATGGVGAPPEKVLIPTMKKEIFFKLVQDYHAAGKLVMVHTWGGDSLDWCIEAGVDSVEHGIYMNQRQAYELSSKNILYVPTAAIYQLLAANDNPLQVASFFAEHARPAVIAHQKAVEGDVRETETPQRDKALSKGREATVKTRNWRRPDKVVIERVDAIDDDHRAERGNERRHVEISDNQTVDQTDHRTNGTDNQNNQRNRHRRHFREHFVGVIHGLQ